MWFESAWLVSVPLRAFNLCSAPVPRFGPVSNPAKRSRLEKTIFAVAISSDYADARELLMAVNTPLTALATPLTLLMHTSAIKATSNAYSTRS
jgi:hypothetical protein